MAASRVSLTGFEASLSTLASVSQRWWPSEEKKTEQKRKVTWWQNQKIIQLLGTQQKWRNAVSAGVITRDIRDKLNSRTSSCLLTDPPLKSSAEQTRDRQRNLMQSLKGKRKPATSFDCVESQRAPTAAALIMDNDGKLTTQRSNSFFLLFS